MIFDIILSFILIVGTIYITNIYFKNKKILYYIETSENEAIEFITEHKGILESSYEILRDMEEAWEYFSEYDVPIGMKEEIDEILKRYEEFSKIYNEKNEGKDQEFNIKFSLN